MNTEGKNLYIVFIVVYFLFFDTHFQLPLLAPLARSLGATPFLLGLIVGTYSLFNILGNLLGGHCCDAKNWKQPLTAGIVMITISLFAYAWAPSAPALLLIRAVHGFAGGLVVPVTLVYLTAVPARELKDNLSRRMSFFGVSIGLASLIGPPLAGILAAWRGYAQAYLTIAALMVLPAILIIFFWQEHTKPTGRRISPAKDYRKIMGTGPLRLAFLMIFALMGATGTLASFLPLQAEALGASPAVTGALFAVFAAAAITAQLFWPLLAARHKLLSYILAGFALFNLALFLIYYLHHLPALFLALALYGLGFGLLFPALLELVAKYSDPAWKGLATGIFFIFFSLGAALVPPLGGLLKQSPAAVSPFLTAVTVSLFLTPALPQYFLKKGAFKNPE